MHPSSDHQELERFLLERLEDLDELRVLVWLHARGERPAVLTEIAVAVGSPTAVAQRTLERLASRGLVAISALEPAEYCFDPQDPETKAGFERLFAEFRVDPSSVMKLMTSVAIERVRTAALRTFGEALRGGGSKPDN